MATDVRSTDDLLAEAVAALAARSRERDALVAQNEELAAIVEAQDARLLALEADAAGHVDRARQAQQLAEAAAQAVRDSEAAAAALAAQQPRLQLEVREARVEADSARAEAAEARAAAAAQERRAAEDVGQLSEALRARKETQYTLLERAAAAEEGALRAADDTAQLQQALRAAHVRVAELDARLQAEDRRQLQHAEQLRAHAQEGAALRQAAVLLQQRLHATDAERLRTGSEVVASTVQLRDMSDKILALLERVKLAEAAKSRAVDSLRAREEEVAALRRHAKASELGRRAKAALEQQLKAARDEADLFRAHVATLAAKVREEAQRAAEVVGDKKGLAEQAALLGARVALLGGRLQAEEEANTAMHADCKRLAEELAAARRENGDAMARLTTALQAADALAVVRRSHDELADKLGVLQQELREQQQQAMLGQQQVLSHQLQHESVARGDTSELETKKEADGDDDLLQADETVALLKRDESLAAPFLLDPKPGQGLLLLRSEGRTAKALLLKLGINEQLRKAQMARPSLARELFVRLSCSLLGLLLAELEGRASVQAATQSALAELEAASRTTRSLIERSARSDEARRRLVVRYARSVMAEAQRNAVLQAKAEFTRPQATPPDTGPAPAPPSRELTPALGGPAVLLDDTGLGDEGVAALLAACKNVLLCNLGDAARQQLPAVGSGGPASLQVVVQELQLRNNGITDEGARALAAFIARGSTGFFVAQPEGPAALADAATCDKASPNSSAAASQESLVPPPPVPVAAAFVRVSSIDLRGNLVTRAGLRCLAEALEASELAQHVYVHASGRIEALGTRAVPDSGDTVAAVVVDVVGIVDCRDQLEAQSSPSQQRPSLASAAASAASLPLHMSIDPLSFVVGADALAVEADDSLGGALQRQAQRRLGGGDLGGGPSFASVAAWAGPRPQGSRSSSPQPRATARPGAAAPLSPPSLHPRPSVPAAAMESSTPSVVDGSAALAALIDEEELELVERERHEAEDRGALRARAREEARRSARLGEMQKEAQWQGRAGGLDVVPVEVSEALGPALQLARTASAVAALPSLTTAAASGAAPLPLARRRAAAPASDATSFAESMELARAALEAADKLLLQPPPEAPPRPGGGLPAAAARVGVAAGGSVDSLGPWSAGSGVNAARPRKK